jgi:phosphoglycerate dehydrogenase-like enzyme
MDDRIVVLAAPTFEPLPLLRETERGAFISDDIASLREPLADADILVVAPRQGALLRKVWPYANKVQWVHALAAGVESLVFDDLMRRSVTLTNSRGIFADDLGEFAIAAMLFFAKDLGRMQRNQRAHEWAPFNVRRLDGATLGIVGYGGIGRAVGVRAEAMGMDLITRGRRGGASLEDVLRASDYLVISTPLTNETRGMIGASELALMKRDAVLINIGRGPVVDEAAMIAALRNGTIRGAALDVFAEEPLPPDHALWDLENVLISPHCADHTDDAHERTLRFFFENLERYRRGEPLENVVDVHAGY